MGIPLIALPIAVFIAAASVGAAALLLPQLAAYIILGLVLLLLLAAVARAKQLSHALLCLKADCEHDIANDNSNNTNSYTTTTSVINEIAELQQTVANLRYLLAACTRFIPRDVITELLADGDTLPQVSMAPRCIAVLFVDIEEFTSLCEALGPNELAGFLELYYQLQSTTIMAAGGVIDKYIGDAIMCIWGAPADIGAAALRACCVALALRDTMRGGNNRRRFNNIGIRNLRVRVGVHYGTALCGNMGCDKRLSYTALGDTVNIAARLESLNKQFGTRILCTGDVIDGIEDVFVTRYLGPVRVVGKSNAVDVYEVLGLSPHFASVEVIEAFVRRHARETTGYSRTRSLSAMTAVTALPLPTDGAPLVPISSRYTLNVDDGQQQARSRSRNTSISRKMDASRQKHNSTRQTVIEILRMLAQNSNKIAVSGDQIRAAETYSDAMRCYATMDFGHARAFLQEYEKAVYCILAHQQQQGQEEEEEEEEEGEGERLAVEWEANDPAGKYLADLLHAVTVAPPLREGWNPELRLTVK